MDWMDGLVDDSRPHLTRTTLRARRVVFATEEEEEHDEDRRPRVGVGVGVGVRCSETTIISNT